eukprot:g4436.t1
MLPSFPRKIFAKSVRAASSSSAQKRVVLVDGTRTPFMLQSTHYNDYMAYDLGRFAIQGLMTKTGLAPKEVDYVLYGTVAQDVKTSNLARECAVGAGLPLTTPAHTVTMACISAAAAIGDGANKILSGEADVVVAGGAETFSDLPIRFSKKMRQKFLGLMKVKGGMNQAKYMLKGFSLGDLAPDPPAIANFATGEIMGHSSDRLSARWGVSREQQDQYALRSHQLAGAAHEKGLLKDEITPVDGHTVDNGIKADSTLEKLASLNPAFTRPHGTHTAANSSFLTDGASACLLMSEEKALSLGYKPKAYLKQWGFAAVDPWDEMLLGPAYSVTQMLQRAKLTMNDIGVWEIHEAFAGQILSNLHALDSKDFAKNNLNGSWKGGETVGEVPRDKLNTLGGSLSLGHPFGATGARLVTTAANRLQREGQDLAMIAACADSGQSVGMILERYPN